VYFNIALSVDFPPLGNGVNAGSRAEIRGYRQPGAW
jgi:hypothetical protein